MICSRSDRKVLLLLLLLPALGFLYLGSNLAAYSKKFLLIREVIKPTAKVHQQTTNKSAVARPRGKTPKLLTSPKTTTTTTTTEEPAKDAPNPEEKPNDDDPVLEDKLMAMIAHERLAGLEHGCQFSGKDYKLDIEAVLASKQKPRFYFSDKYKLLLCEVPKCGSTSWKKSILTMEGVVNSTKPDDIPGGVAHVEAIKLSFWEYFNASDPASVTKAKERISTYTRVMTVREPLKRLVSAYKDKMLPTGTGGERFGGMSKKIHETYKDRNSTKEEGTKRESEYATWEEFVRYLLDPKKTVYMDVHWNFYSRFCSPCLVKYDYVVKLETVYHDMKYLSNRIGFDLTRFFPVTKEESRHKKWDDEYTQYYARLSKEDKEKLYKMYLNQYELFGYPRPDFI